MSKSRVFLFSLSDCNKIIDSQDLIACVSHIWVRQREREREQFCSDALPPHTVVHMGGRTSTLGMLCTDPLMSLTPFNEYLSAVINAKHRECPSLQSQGWSLPMFSAYQGRQDKHWSQESHALWVQQGSPICSTCPPPPHHAHRKGRMPGWGKRDRETNSVHATQLMKQPPKETFKAENQFPNPLQATFSVAGLQLHVFRKQLGGGEIWNRSISISIDNCSYVPTEHTFVSFLLQLTFSNFGTLNNEALGHYILSQCVYAYNNHELQCV